MKDQEKEENTYTKNDKNPRIHFLADSLKSQPQTSQRIKTTQGSGDLTVLLSLSLTPTEPGGEEAPKAGTGQPSGQLRVEPEPRDHRAVEQAPRFTLFWTDLGSSDLCYPQMGPGESW